MNEMRPTLFILSYQRPIYLWACLDSIYKNTRTSTRVVLMDNGSTDPLVHRVIDSFQSRGLLDEVHRFQGNRCSVWAPEFFATRRQQLGDVFFYMDSDVVVKDTGRCWIAAMQDVMARNPQLAMLGSMIDKADFEDQSEIELRIRRQLTPEEENQIKAHSPERTLTEIGKDEICSPFNPPGRLLALRTDPTYDLAGTVFSKNDDGLHKLFLENGWSTGIYGGVVHRHLSLFNFFDYGDDYSMVDRHKQFYWRRD